MNPSQMLYEMCHDVLTAAEIKAICKNRGFSDAAVASRSVFEQVFLSPAGVASALNSLSEPEVAALHLLRLHDQMVDVTFFQRLYGGSQAGGRWYGTFTQQYKPIYDEVQRNLVRKGVLLIGVARTNSPTKTKMELWRYRFPAEFGSFLPPLFSPLIHSGSEGTVTDDRLRAALHRLVQEDPAARQPPAVLQLKSGGLTIGTHPFSVAAIREWRQTAWEADIRRAQLQEKNQSPLHESIFKGYLLPEGEYRTPSPLPAVSYAFAQLGPDEWLAPDQLNVLLDLVYAGTGRPSAATICAAGWETGCLARYEANGKEYYRLAEARSAHDAPEYYLPAVDGRVFVDLDRVPYEVLELLNGIADLAVKGGRLEVMPSFSKLVPGWNTVRDHLLLRYLRAHSATFQAACKKLEAAWGRLIVHENLLVARVTDLSLRVALQQALRDDSDTSSTRPVFLSDEYLAFPRARLGEIERLVKKAGHVIKTVHA